MGAVVDPAQLNPTPRLVRDNPEGDHYQAPCPLPAHGSFYPPTLITGLGTASPTPRAPGSRRPRRTGGHPPSGNRNRCQPPLQSLLRRQRAQRVQGPLLGVSPLAQRNAELQAAALDQLLQLLQRRERPPRLPAPPHPESTSVPRREVLRPPAP